MNRILICLGLLIAFSASLRAQDAALVERVNRLTVYVEELMEDKARHQKTINDLQREVQNLREELQRAQAGASREEVAAVAETVKQLDRKQRQDMELVAKQIEQLGKKAVAERSSVGSSAPQPRPERGWEYTIEAGNTLSAIAKAYSENFNIKITSADILKANPGLKADRLQVGQVIFIPEK